MVNHVHIEDLLRNPSDNARKLEDGLGELVAFFWQMAVDRQFPETNVSVEYQDGVINILNE